MNTYKVILNCGVYGIFDCGCKANTPYDAFEREFYKKLRKRWMENFVNAKVVALDGSKRRWEFTERP